MMMSLAARIESGSAHRAHCLAVQILADGQFTTAASTQDRLLSEFGTRPGLSGMAAFRLVAVKTGIIAAATFELDGDYIDGTSIVDTAGARIYLDASYRNS